MSFFKPFEYKERPDVQKNERPKPPVLRFLEIYYRKLWRLVAANIIYFVIVLPILIYFYLMLCGFASQVLGEEFIDPVPVLGIMAGLVLGLPNPALIAALIVSVVLSGPARMGFTYLLRNFAREEHAWLSDLFSRARSNFKQGIFLGVLDFALAMILIYNITNAAADTGAIGLALMLSRYLSFLAFIVLLIARRFSYLMAVTVELGITQILKNSLLLSVAGLWRNLLSLLISIAVWALTLFVYPAATMFLLPLFTYALAGFSTVFISWPLIDKYLVKPSIERGNN